MFNEISWTIKGFYTCSSFLRDSRIAQPYKTKVQFQLLKPKPSYVFQSRHLKQCQKLLGKVELRCHSQSHQKNLVWGFEHSYFLSSRTSDVIQCRSMDISGIDSFATFCLESEAVLLWCCNVSNHLILGLLSCTHMEHQSKLNVILKIII